jgi:hypothetical protein
MEESGIHNSVRNFIRDNNGWAVLQDIVIPVLVPFFPFLAVKTAILQSNEKYLNRFVYYTIDSTVFTCLKEGNQDEKGQESKEEIETLK